VLGQLSVKAKTEKLDSRLRGNDKKKKQKKKRKKKKMLDRIMGLTGFF